MPQQSVAQVYSQGFGSVTTQAPHLDVRAPTTTDIRFPVGQRWINTVGNAEYVLTSFSVSNGVSSANWCLLGTNTGALNTLTGDAGGAISPAAGNITVAGTASQITTTGSGSTITWSLSNTLVAPGTLTVTGLLTASASATVNTAGTALNLGSDNSGDAVNLGVGTVARSIGIGNSAAAHTVTVGSTTGAASLTLHVGTGNFALDGVAASTYAVGASTTTGTITIGGTAQTGTLTLGSSSGTNIVAIGAGAGATTVNIAGGAGGNTVNVATGAAVNTVVVGSTNTSSTTTVQAGTGGLLLKGGQVLPVKNVNNAASPYSLLATDQFVAVDPTVGVVTVALPASPSTGRFLTIYDATGQAATHNITVDGGGHNISSGGASAATASLTTAFSSMNLWFNGTIWNAQKIS